LGRQRRLAGPSPARSETFCVAFPFVEKRRRKEVTALSILWIILIIVLVLALLGFFSRGRW
jgi:hypothetical protein